MKIKKYTPENTPTATRKGTVQVSFNRSGLISISPAASDLLELNEHSKVAILQNEEAPEDWYITKDPSGFDIRIQTSGKGYQFNHAGLSHAVLDATVGKTTRIAALPMSLDPDEDAGGHWLNGVKPYSTKPIVRKP